MRRRILNTLGEAAVSLARGWRSSALAGAAIASAVFVLGVFLIVSHAVDDAVGQWAAAAELSVFLTDEADASARGAIERLLKAERVLADVRFVSGAEASRRFARSFPDLAPLTATQGGGPLPASFEARVRTSASRADLSGFAERLRRQPGVLDVRLDQELLTGISRVVTAGRLVAGTLAAILVLAAALAIASVVRLSYVARRDEMDVLYLLGAPLSAIRGPFIAEGALQGAFGTGLALVLLFLARTIVVRSYGQLLGDMTPDFLPGWEVVTLLLGGTCIGALAGLSAVRGQRRDMLE